MEQQLQAVLHLALICTEDDPRGKTNYVRCYKRTHSDWEVHLLSIFSHLLRSNIYGSLYGSKILELPNIHSLSLLLYCCMSKRGEENCECFVKLCVIFQKLMSLFSCELWECLFNFSEVNDFVFRQPIWRDCYQNWHIGNPIMNCLLPTHSKFQRLFGYFIQVFRNLLSILRTMVM